jgi:hypothetical protein
MGTNAATIEVGKTFPEELGWKSDLKQSQGNI